MNGSKPAPRLSKTVAFLVPLLLVLFFGSSLPLSPAASTQVEAGIFGGGYEIVLTPTGPDRIPTADEWWTMFGLLKKRFAACGAEDVTVEDFRDEGLLRVRFQTAGGEETNETVADAGLTDLLDPVGFQMRDSDGNVLLDGRDLAECFVADQSGEYVVCLNLTPAGSVKFAEATGNSIGKQIGIYVDDELILSPRIDERIDGGEIVIDGMADRKEAMATANRIGSCLLPFPVEVVSRGPIRWMAARVLFDAVNDNHGWPLVIGLLAMVLILVGFLVLAGSRRRRRSSRKRPQ
jgi:SecD/SecF fusion protein